MRTLPLSALALLLPLTAFCADPAREALEQKFKDLDKNHDGVVTPDELPQQRIFKFLDKDGDGRITMDEALAAIPAASAIAKNLAGSDTPPPPPTGPHPVSASQAGIGRRIDDLPLTNLDGQTRPLSQALGKNGAVIAFTSTTCPVSKRYAPGLARLESTLREKGVSLVLNDPFASDKPEALRAMVKELGVHSLVMHDREGKVLAGLQGSASTEVFLVDATRTLLYRGALDDQYGLNYSKDAPSQTYLLDAVESMLAGRKVVIAATSAPGCDLEAPKLVTKAPAAVTYHNDVQRILQQNCAECHHEGGIGPFSLEDLADVKDRAKTIRRVVEQGVMPPWFALPAEAGQTSPWANDRSLSPDAKKTLLAWLDSGDRPEGLAADAPKPVKWPQGWTLGEPDAVLTFEKPIEVKAEGIMPYITVTVPTNFPEDRWVSAVEVQPSAREVVHHVLVSTAGKEDVKLNGARFRDGDPGTYFAIYVPGTTGERFPAGMAKKLPAGTALKFQMHYTPNGHATTDITRLGLHFTKEAPKWEIRTAAAMNMRINIPAGEASHQETAILPVPPNVLVLSFFPHMHVRGKSFKYELVGTDGTNRTILDVPRYDFNWQLGYQLAAPFVTTAGTFLKCTATYDNSPANKANPDPAKNVHWGPQTTDEMMLGYVKYAVPVKPVAETAYAK